MHLLIIAGITLIVLGIILWAVARAVKNSTKQSIAKKFCDRAFDLKDVYPYRAKSYVDLALEIVGKEKRGELINQEALFLIEKSFIDRLVCDGEAYFAKGNFNESLRIAREALEFSPNWRNAILLCEKSRAMFEYHRALSLVNAYPKEALKALCLAEEAAAEIDFELPKDSAATMEMIVAAISKKYNGENEKPEHSGF